MKLSRFFFVLVPLGGSVLGAQAGNGSKPQTVAQSEARNEASAPSFSQQVQAAQRITYFLTDALLLSNAQQHAVQTYTVAQRKALLLAVTPAHIAEAGREYQESVRRVLATSQLSTYVALRKQLDGTVFPLDAVELAVR